MKSLGNFFFIFMYRLQTEIASPTLVQNQCILHGLHLKNLQSQKKVLQVLQTREST